MCIMPHPLVKMDITSSQNEHFDQIDIFKKLWFLVV
jgi:hypothetical protein